MADGAGLGRAIVAAVWPVREEFETGHFYGWRVWLAALALITLGGLVMNYALAFGYVTLFGFTGFAQASDMTDLKASQRTLSQSMTQNTNEIMGVVIGEQIFDLNYKRCAAIKQQSDDAIQAYSYELQSKMDYYQRMTGRIYTLQGCP